MVENTGVGGGNGWVCFAKITLRRRRGGRETGKGKSCGAPGFGPVLVAAVKAENPGAPPLLHYSPGVFTRGRKGR